MSYEVHMSKLIRPLTTQLLDLRSSVTREASNTVRIMAQSMGEDFSSLAHKFMHINSLFKMVSSATKLISEHGHLCCVAILSYVQEPKIIDNIYDNLKSKSNNMRAKSSFYLYMILGSWPDYILDKYVEVFENYFKASLTDAYSDCRYNTRLAFLRFKELFPNEADEIYEVLDSATQKAIIDEEENGGEGKATFNARQLSPGSGTNKNRKGTHSAMRKQPTSKPTGGYLSPGTGTRKTEITRKSKNRLQNKTINNKFLSEERDITEKNKRAISKDAVLTTGFKNLKVAKVEQPEDTKGVYISKYHKPSTASNFKSKRNFSKNSVEDDHRHPISLQDKKKQIKHDSENLNTYGLGTYPKYGHSGGAKEEIVQDEDLKELDDKIHDISEIELDPEDNKEASFYPQPYQDYKIKPQASSNQEITKLLERAKSSNWIDRINAFEQLSTYVGNKSSASLSFTSFERIIQTHVDHMNDNHFKVILVVQESFGKIIHSFSETLEPHLGDIVPRLLANLSDAREKVSKSANLLLNTLKLRYGGDKLVPHFMGIIDPKEDVKIVGATLEVLSLHLVQATDEYFTQKSTLKNMIRRIGSIVFEHSKNETITMPALGVLIALRDLYMHKTIKSIKMLPEGQYELIQKLSVSFAPDLATNLVNTSTHSNTAMGSSKDYSAPERRIGNHGSGAKYGDDSSGVPFFQGYDQVLSEGNSNYSKHNGAKEVSALGFSDSKTEYSKSDIDVIIDNLKHSIDIRIDCMNHLQRLIQLCLRESPSQRVAQKNRKVWKENRSDILHSLYD